METAAHPIRNHVAWAVLGGVAAAGMWTAYSIPGAIAMFAAIGLAFLMWHKLGRRGSWLALVVMGFAMGGMLAWQAVEGTRCPAPGERIIIKDGKPPVSCDEIRASAGSMAMFFFLIAGIGVGAPLYARKDDDAPDDGELDALA
ncbi:MAG: hypothetical protein JWO69_45 [Thermoleophilia bacterium]|jgi:hypothetical protein|nr:hypothetical protein [Thermoleophilia bacterium]